MGNAIHEPLAMGNYINIIKGSLYKFTVTIYTLVEFDEYMSDLEDEEGGIVLMHFCHYHWNCYV